jgi:hypothetical protein
MRLESSCGFKQCDEHLEWGRLLQELLPEYQKCKINHKATFLLGGGGVQGMKGPGDLGRRGGGTGVQTQGKEARGNQQDKFKCRHGKVTHRPGRVKGGEPGAASFPVLMFSLDAKSNYNPTTHTQCEGAVGGRLPAWYLMGAWPVARRY